jgi:uncharacterized lipoprotein YmbA
VAKFNNEDKEMVKKGLFNPVAAIILLFFVLGGCVGKSPPPRFYRLTSLVESQPEMLQKRATENIAVGIGPVTVADYLDQAKIVTRSSENEIERAEFDQWSGSFKNNVTEVLAENLSNLLGSERISLYPWRSYIAVDYQLVVNISRCDGRLGKDVVMTAQWSVYKGKEKQLVAMKRSSIPQAVDSSEYAALVSAYSRALGELSREISETIQDEIGW